ncbi:hypothetical protein [Halorubellus sp. PRR65]|uniref:hypothetical protein n=1 Tax=Halorubellus sp. PRR65 TaxID=3098148 RepID=UPI002B2617B8|nr:hypothetical protein [Halorubellus sp. PRR65]
MPATTGASHGFAAFATLLIGTMFSKFVWEILPPLGELSLLVVETVRQFGVGVPASRQFAGTLVVMVGLSFLWGVVYHVGRH